MAIFLNVQFTKQQYGYTLSHIFAEIKYNLLEHAAAVFIYLYKCEVIGPDVFPWKQMFTNIQVHKSVGETKYRKFLLM